MSPEIALLQQNGRFVNRIWASNSHVCIKNGRFEWKRWAPQSHLASKIADLNERERWTPKSHFCTKNDRFGSKRWTPKSHVYVKNYRFERKRRAPNSHFCIENIRSELKSGAPKSREITFFKLYQKLPIWSEVRSLETWRWNSDERFWKRILASSRQIAHMLFGWPPCRPGRRFAFWYPFWTTRPRFARTNIEPEPCVICCADRIPVCRSAEKCIS